MANETIPTITSDKPISKEEFEMRDVSLTDALDKLEEEVFPPKPKPAPIGGML